MAATITALSTEHKIQLLALAAQLTEANEKRFCTKTPVADIATLKAITTPEEGERRQILSANQFIEYVYNAGNSAPSETCDDASAGGWLLTTPLSAPEAWQPSFDYVADDFFSFEVAADGVDREGNEILAGVLYLGRYIDASGDPVATTSGTALDTAELAKLQVVHGEVAGIETIMQAAVDALILNN